MADTLTRPKNITDSQWSQALSLYNTAKEKGDRYPELTVAQAALETGWFKSPSGKYNYFGQKASSKQAGTTLGTKEMSGNKTYSTQSKFRDYEDIGQAVDDRLKKWGSKYANANTVDEAINKIWQYDPKTGQGKGYATDVNYGSKLKTILGSMGIASSTANPPSQQGQQASYTPEDTPIAPLYTDMPNMGGMATLPDEEDSEVVETESAGTTAANDLREQSFIKDYAEQQEVVAQNAVAQQNYEQIMPEAIDAVQYQPIEQPQYQAGGIIKDNNGYRNPDNWGEVVEINSPIITMEGVSQPLLGVSKQTGEQKMMYPGQKYNFQNTKQVIEYPIFKK